MKRQGAKFRSSRVALESMQRSTLIWQHCPESLVARLPDAAKRWRKGRIKSAETFTSVLLKAVTSSSESSRMLYAQYELLAVYLTVFLMHCILLQIVNPSVISHSVLLSCVGCLSHET